MTQGDVSDGAREGERACRLTSWPIRAPLEAAVSAYLRRPWGVISARDMSEFACHPCAILAGDSFAVFAKYSEDADAPAQFECEVAGLQYLATHAAVRIPTPLGIVPAERGTLFIMEALQAVERAPWHWHDIGRTLARIHRNTADQFGFHRNGYLGPMFQDNTPAPDWATFFRERRLLPWLQVVIDSGNLPSAVVSRVEKLAQRLPELCGPACTPTLLHGDAQQNNFISTAQGTCVIDPAIYYGNPEADLALIDAWMPAPDDFLAAYREEMPLDPGFHERRSLWRVPLYLAAVALEGPVHLGRLTGALQPYG
jgi:protein-ribulosamine 3-kinase